MLTRRPLKKLFGPLAAGFIVTAAMLGSVPANAQVCGANLSVQNPSLADAAALGGSWAGSSATEVPPLRFRVRAGCAEVSALGWGWVGLMESPEVEGSYEATLSRRSASGLIEVLDLRFRFAGGAGTSWIEIESWYHSPEVRNLGGKPRYLQTTLFHRL